jgi:putative inorganic carbon (HCO3(-)) transporter
MNGVHPIPVSTRRRIPKASTAEISARSRYAILCLIAYLGVMALCAKMGVLRVPDLVVTIPTLIAATALAMRDSKRLATFVVVVWILSRFVRRLIDWQMGGFESLTVLSLLPMMTSLTLIIPTIPRLQRLPNRISQALLLIVGPTLVATVIGIASYGSAAIIDAGGWLLPLLFIPYYAARPTPLAERLSTLRQVVVLAAIVAAYGWFQFVYLPPWDAMWLRESGMTSSMGQAETMSVRVWGTLSSSGPAAAFWASALGLLMCGVRPAPARGALHGMLIGSVLLLSRVRVCWLSPIVGLLTYGALRGRRGAGEAVGFGVLIAIVVAIAMMLPGGDLVSDRLQSFGNLEQDNSLRTRLRIVSELVDSVAAHPFGEGIGYMSASRISGGGGKVTGLDNGFGAVAYSLGLPGAMFWFVGIACLAAALRTKVLRTSGVHRQIAVASLVQLAMSFASLASAFFMGGEMGIVMWLTMGLALAPVPVIEPGTVASAGPSTFPQLHS